MPGLHDVCRPVLFGFGRSLSARLSILAVGVVSWMSAAAAYVAN